MQVKSSSHLRGSFCPQAGLGFVENTSWLEHTRGVNDAAQGPMTARLGEHVRDVHLLRDVRLHDGDDRAFGRQRIEQPLCVGARPSAAYEGQVTRSAVDETLRDSLLGSDMSFIGKVIVVHEGQDDLTTQPDGSSGEPVGCGFIEAASEDILSRGPAPDRGV